MIGSDRIRTDHALDSCFDAFSSREPVSTSLENAMDNKRKKNMDLQLKSKTAVVTGASIGIGRAVAKALAREGVRVAAVARRNDLLEQLAQEARSEGTDIIPIVQDIM